MVIFDRFVRYSVESVGDIVRVIVFGREGGGSGCVVYGLG